MKLRAFLVAALTLFPCLASAAPGSGPKDIDGPPELVPPAVVARDDLQNRSFVVKVTRLFQL